jgi:energy-coupling factor transporter ATP-binding protein EcfA2
LRLRRCAAQTPSSPVCPSCAALRTIGAALSEMAPGPGPPSAPPAGAPPVRSGRGSRVPSGALPIVTAKHVHRSFGIRRVLEDISVTINTGEHVGLVGVNGSGKSTLVRILAGLDAPDRARSSIAAGPTIAYLEQEPRFPAGMRAREACSTDSARGPRPARATSPPPPRSTAATAPAQDRLLAEQSATAGNEIERLGGWERIHEAESLLDRLGVPTPTRSSTSSAAGSAAASPWRGSSPRSPIWRSSTSRPTISTSPRSSGSSATSTSSSPARSSSSPTIATSSTASPAARSSSTAARCYSYDGGFATYLEAKAERAGDCPAHRGQPAELPAPRARVAAPPAQGAQHQAEGPHRPRPRRDRQGPAAGGSRARAAGPGRAQRQHDPRAARPVAGDRGPHPDQGPHLRGPQGRTHRRARAQRLRQDHPVQGDHRADRARRRQVVLGKNTSSPTSTRRAPASTTTPPSTTTSPRAAAPSRSTATRSRSASTSSASCSTRRATPRRSAPSPAASEPASPSPSCCRAAATWSSSTSPPTTSTSPPSAPSRRC